MTATQDKRKGWVITYRDWRPEGAQWVARRGENGNGMCAHDRETLVKMIDVLGDLK